jgi:hypothetical protein
LNAEEQAQEEHFMEVATAITKQLRSMQTTYDARVLAAATLVFSADIYNLLISAGMTDVPEVAHAFGHALVGAITPRKDEQAKVQIVPHDIPEGTLQ